MGKSSGNSQASMGEMFSALAAQQAAAASQATAMEQLQWAKQVYNEQKPYIEQATQEQLSAQKQADDFAKQQQDYYLSTYQPLETEFVNEARDYDTPERERQAAGAAEETVANQFEQARASTTKQLESFGIDPSSTRYAALDTGSRTAQAAAAAGAGNQAIRNTQATGLQLKSAAINTGRGYPGSVNSGYGTGTGAGSASTGGLNSELSTGAGAMGNPTAWMGNAIGGYNAANGAWGSYNNSTQPQSSGLGAVLGTAAGIASKALFKFADGGRVPARRAIQIPPGNEPRPDFRGMDYTPPRVRIPPGNEPRPNFQGMDYIPARPQIPPGNEPPADFQGMMDNPRRQAPGGAVPTDASPTGGKAIDDVPARLTPGEFVVPRDVVGWYGEKHMYDLVAKAQADRQKVQSETTAQPQVRAAIPMDPTFVSNPQAAIPMAA